MKKVICAMLAAFVLSLVPIAQATGPSDARGAQQLHSQRPPAHATAKKKNKRNKKNRHNLKRGKKVNHRNLKKQGNLKKRTQKKKQV